jgi:hypothetical protein
VAGSLAELAWQEATRLAAMYCQEDLKAIRGATAGRRGPRPPKTTWWARKLAMHLAVEGADEPPGSVARGLRCHRGTVYHALDDVARARAADGDLDLDLRSLETRMSAWRVRTVRAAAQVSFIKNPLHSTVMPAHGKLMGGG